MAISAGQEDPSDLIDEEEVWRLYQSAGEPEHLLLAPRFGHAEDGLTPTFAERLGQRLLSLVG